MSVNTLVVSHVSLNIQDKTVPICENLIFFVRLPQSKENRYDVLHLCDFYSRVNLFKLACASASSCFDAGVDSVAPPVGFQVLVRLMSN